MVVVGEAVLIKVDAAVGELAERSLLLQLCSAEDIVSADIPSSSAPLWPVHRVSIIWCLRTGCLLGVLR